MQFLVAPDDFHTCLSSLLLLVPSTEYGLYLSCRFIILSPSSCVSQSSEDAVGQHTEGRGETLFFFFTMLRCLAVVRGETAARSTNPCLGSFFTFLNPTFCTRVCVRLRAPFAAAEITLTVRQRVFDSHRKSPLTPSGAPPPSLPALLPAVSHPAGVQNRSPQPLESSFKTLFIY